jgi:hypothetical protein
MQSHADEFSGASAADRAPPRAIMVAMRSRFAATVASARRACRAPLLALVVALLVAPAPPVAAPSVDEAGRDRDARPAARRRRRARAPRVPARRDGRVGAGRRRRATAPGLQADKAVNPASLMKLVTTRRA